MPSLKTLLSDHETVVDLISNEAIANTIVSLICDRPDRPITVGVHGDWGAGKSSILEMVEARLADHPRVVCLKFNGWRFQGFEDAKIALVEGIVTALVESRPFLTKATEEVKEVFERINWLKVAKRAGTLAVTALTGIPSPDLLQSTIEAATSAFSKKNQSPEEMEEALKGLEGLLNPPEDSHQVPAEIRKFHKAFDRLLEKAGVDQLIVLIDDLDRCLPDTAVETLEAVRLLVFTARTAFVIAADEAMIEYSVRKHFPDLPESSGPQNYARNYLEKLIQVPFRIPALGEAETRIYVALVLAEAALGQDSTEFKKLLQHAREIVQRPWLGLVLDDKAVRDALGSKRAETAELLLLSDRIGPILARGTSGNPRQVKRFLNTMLLREHIAAARGFGEDIQMGRMAKLMLAERFKPAFFDHLVLEASSDPAGVAQTLALLERSPASEEAPKDGESKKAKADKPQPASSAAEREHPWGEDDWVQTWALQEPKLTGVDLRPYVFIANQQARMGLATALGPLLPIMDSLMGSQLAVAALEGDLKKLTAPEATTVFTELTSRIRQSSLRQKPAGVEGLKILVKAHPPLQSDLLNFLETLPSRELGLWVLTGWEGLVTTQVDRYRSLLQRWAEYRDNAGLSNAAAQLLKPKKKGGI